MKHTRKCLTAAFMILICLFAFTGCGQKKVTAYQSYVKNLLDVNYKGDYTNYVKQNKGNETDALALYQDCLSNLANQLITHYNLNTNQSVEVNQTFTTVAAAIYNDARYEVSESYKENGDYYVDVTIYPLAILDQSYDEIIAYIEAFNKDVDDGVYNDVKKEEYDKKFANGIASILSSHTEKPQYKDPVVIKALINDDGEYYSISSDSLKEIDQAMIATETADATEADTSEE